MEINKAHIFVALGILFGVNAAKAQDINRCADILLEGSYIPTCQNVRDYFTCVIKELRLDVPGAYGGSIREDLEENLQNALIQLGMRCYIDFDAIMNEIRSEEGRGYGVDTTEMPYKVTSNDHGCVNNRPYGCKGVPDGHYAVCGPECQRGVYISCTHYELHLRWCAKGWYQHPAGYRFEEKLVFDSYLGTCERSTRSCPRKLDNYLEFVGQQPVTTH